MVGSLAVNAVYLFKVQAATSVGAGDFTPIVEVHTTEGVGTTPAIGAHLSVKVKQIFSGNFFKLDSH